MRYYCLFLLFVVLFFGSLECIKNDYMTAKSTPVILEELKMEPNALGYNTYAVFMLADGKEFTKSVTPEFYESTRVGTKVIIPVRGLDFNPNVYDIVNYMIFPVLFFMVSLVGFWLLFWLSVEQLCKDVKQYKNAKRKLQK